MKKILLVITLIFTLAANAFATEEKIKPEVLDAFKNKFSNAQDVTWVAGNNYYKATFNYYGSQMFAYYTTTGKLMGVTRYMSSTELPLYLRNTLKEKYTNYWISNVVEESNKNGFSYYITIENADIKIVLKSKCGGDWTIYSKQQKL
jgi:hypothetical protein